jgi:hypothetical protein
MRPKNPTAPRLITSRRDRRALTDDDLQFQRAYASLAVVQARAAMEAASNAYFIDTAMLTTEQLEERGKTANETQANWRYLDQVLGRIDREITRRAERKIYRQRYTKIPSH